MPPALYNFCRIVYFNDLERKKAANSIPNIRIIIRACNFNENHDISEKSPWLRWIMINTQLK